MFRKVISLLAIPATLLAQQQPVSRDTLFRPISLAEAVRLAQENNVAAVSAGNQIRTAQNQVRSARAQLYPTLTVSANQNKSAGERLGQSGTLVPYNSVWTYGTGLSSSLTLFDGGKTFADIRTQRANVTAAEASQTSAQFNLALQVKTQYNAVLAANESDAAGRAQLALAEQQLATSIAKLKAGAANVSDSLRNVVAVGNARLAILNAQQSFRTASAALTRLVGTTYLVTAVASDTAALSTTPIDSAAVVQAALNGPAVRQFDAQVASATSVERSAKSAYLPTVRANFGYSGNGTDPYGIGPNPFPFSRSVGLSLNYTIFQGFQRENQVASAQISVENAVASLKDQKLAAQQNIITQVGALRNAEEKMLVQQLSLQASQEDLRVVQQRYALGAGTLLDVLTSQSSLITARQQLIQARLDYRNARAQIESIIGRDLP
jgi:outer membrane protein